MAKKSVKMPLEAKLTATQKEAAKRQTAHRRLQEKCAVKPGDMKLLDQLYAAKQELMAHTEEALELQRKISAAKGGRQLTVEP